MKFDFKKTGAMGILFSIALGFAQMTWATIEGIKQRLGVAEKSLAILDDDRSDIKPMLAEIRKDIKEILNRRR